MTHPAQTRYHHVANGTSTTHLIQAAGIPGTLSLWADPLHEGPVPGGLSDDELLKVRARHLAGPAKRDVDPVNDLRRRRLLVLAKEGPVDLATIFPRMHDGEKVYYVTDSSLTELAESLSRTSPPLLTLTSGRDPADGGLGRSVAITDVGRVVLDGQQDRIVTCGINRWLGGVHLKEGSDQWRWDGARGCISSD